MSPTPAPINVTEDSSTDRALIRLALDKLEKEVIQHAMDDRDVQKQLLLGMDKLNRYAAQLRVIVALLTISIGGLLAATNWVVGHLVMDKLVELNLVEYSRASGGLVP